MPTMVIKFQFFHRYNDYMFQFATNIGWKIIWMHWVSIIYKILDPFYFKAAHHSSERNLIIAAPTLSSCLFDTTLSFGRISSYFQLKMKLSTSDIIFINHLRLLRTITNLFTNIIYLLKSSIYNFFIIIPVN